MIYKIIVEGEKSEVTTSNYNAAYMFRLDLIKKGMKAELVAVPEYHGADIQLEENELFVKDDWGSYVGLEVYEDKFDGDKRIMFRFGDNDAEGLDIPFDRFLDLVKILKGL